MPGRAKDDNVKLVFIQRSRGYAVRKTLSCAEIGEICKTVRAANPHAVIMVDNCYGEFVEEIEPTQVGADLVAGSLIDSPAAAWRRRAAILRGVRIWWKTRPTS